jgi:hypothetical protein
MNQLAMHDLYTLFPALRDISYQLPDVLDKCQTMTTHYLEKHLELLNLAKKYKYYFDLFMHLIKNFGKSLNALGDIEISPDLLNDIAPLQEKQAEIMKEYEDIIQFYEAKGISFAKIYDDLEYHINDLFSAVIPNQQKFQTFADANEYANQLNAFYQIEKNNTITSEFPHLSGILKEGDKKYIVFISPVLIEKGKNDHEYQAKKIEISREQYEMIIKGVINDENDSMES